MEMIILLSMLIHLVLTSIFQLCLFVGMILVVGFVLGYLQDLSRSYWSVAFGRTGFLLTAWIGTPIHELGHAIMCIVFGHRIVRIQWFPTRTENGQLGYVSHTYNPKSSYQKIGNFFIGVAPVFSGIAALVVLMYYFVPQSYQLFMKDVAAIKIDGPANEIGGHLFSSMLALWKSLFSGSNFSHPSFLLFLFLAICISTHIALSHSDINGALNGVVTIFIFLLILNITTSFLHVSLSGLTQVLGTFQAYFLVFASVALIFSCMSVLISFLFYTIKTILP